MAKIFSVDVQVAMTAYIKADSEADAMRIARERFTEIPVELPLGFVDDEIEITGDTINDDLGDITLSPAVTFKGPYDDQEPDLSFDSEYDE